MKPRWVLGAALGVVCVYSGQAAATAVAESGRGLPGEMPSSLVIASGAGRKVVPTGDPSSGRRVPTEDPAGPAAPRFQSAPQPPIPVQPIAPAPPGAGLPAAAVNPIAAPN